MITITDSRGWSAEIMFGAEQENVVHMEGRVTADSKGLALQGAQWIMDMFGKGRACFVRCEPEADTYRNFDTKTEHHRGYVRFSFLTEPSNWSVPENTQFVGFSSFPEAS